MFYSFRFIESQHVFQNIHSFLMQILKNLCNLYFCFTQNSFRKSNSYVEFNVLDVRDRPFDI